MTLTASERAIYAQVLERDDGLCFCGAPADDVHHILPKSKCSKKHPPAWLWSHKNLISLCRKHHARAQNPAWRIRLLAYLAEKFGYDYTGEEWRGYI